MGLHVLRFPFPLSFEAEREESVCVEKRAVKLTPFIYFPFPLSISLIVLSLNELFLFLGFTVR